MQQRNPRRSAGARARGRLLALALALTTVGAPVRAPAAPEPGPSTVVEAFHAALLEVMREAATLDVAERYRRLESPVKSAFHLPLMIRIASAGYWQEASATQQQALVEAFERISVGNYANRFDGYSGERFETVGEEPGPRGTTLVTTRLVQPDDDPIRLTYVVKAVGEGFRIVDVLLARGVSELAVRRSEYQGVLGKAGVDGLIDALSRKADELVGAGR